MAIPAVDMTAARICLCGLGVSSARFAEDSKPVKSRIPYSTPKKIPGQPSAEDDGRNGLKLFADPSFTMTEMKKTVTTMMEISASASCTRVEIRTPKYRTRATIARNMRLQAQPGSGLTLNSEAMVDCR